MTFLARLTRSVAACCTVGAPLLAAGLARADPRERDAVVVVVSPPGALDAYRLRGAVGVELGVDAVGPDDPRAPTARGSFTVTVDPQTHHLTVSYLARSEPVTRTVDLPANPEAAQREAVLLAGNLGRDEASEIAAQLRHAAPPRPRDERSPRPTAPIDDTLADDREAARKAAELQATLDYYAAQDRRARTAFAWACAGIGVGLAGVIVAEPFVDRGGANFSSDVSTALAVAALPGASMVGTAVILALNETPLERLAEYDRQGGGAQATAGAWARWAAHERSARRLGGVALIVSGSLEMALGALVALDSQSGLDPSTRTLEGTALGGVGAAFTLWGIAQLTSAGPTETALHAFERAHGIPLWGLAEHIGIAPAPGGAAASFRATF